MTARRLRTIFNQERHRFSLTFPIVADVRLVLHARHYERDTTPRDVGWFDYETRTLNLVRAILTRSEGVVRGVIRHELGHAADEETSHGFEARADRNAKIATGSSIRYTTDGLQHATHGRAKRPDWLHK